MSSEIEVNHALQKAISDSYKAANYSHAILDAMKFLTKVIREKTGEDGDGVDLLKTAFSGDSPLLKMNRLQTKTERSIQEGYYLLMRGLYQGIRNPRAHEHMQDTKADAVAIVLLVDFLVRAIQSSDGPFSPRDFVERVFTDEFYPEGNYAGLLAAQIPIHKRLETLFELYGARVDPYKIGPICRQIYKHLDENERNEFLDVVSSKLMDFLYDYELEFEVQEDLGAENEIALHLQLLSPDVWPYLNRAAKWRVEAFIVEILENAFKGFDEKAYISYGEMELNSETYTASLANEFLDKFEFDNRDRILRALLEILNNSTIDGTRYVLYFFLPYLPDLVVSNKEQKEAFIQLIANAIKVNQSEVLLSNLPYALLKLPTDWAKPLNEQLPFLSLDRDS